MSRCFEVLAYSTGATERRRRWPVSSYLFFEIKNVLKGSIILRLHLIDFDFKGFDGLAVLLS